MVSYGETTQKCKVCEKKVYLVEELTADSKVYHKFCFRCHHCKGTLKLSNYSSYEGVVYCKPHFDQLFKRTGSLSKSFKGAPRTAITDRSTELNTKMSNLFSGTQDKCIACDNKVYPLEKVAVDEKLYHKACFKCSHGRCVISPSNYVAHEQRIYCRHHHAQLFMQKGNFSKLDRYDPSTAVNGTQPSLLHDVVQTEATPMALDQETLP
ncbi:LIM domain-containing protein WLIM1-like [Salvia hispanica]|uniref:LIM domain-containing protein WLIM1-like n=1 Tax=Salvia hispanica TaxID=49212 RepID=UPI00200971C3|nr:LIM domain-containing protein WLIM1-like [Salvia hispanica]XP_047974103.1 LIM domain-containing protein WLIM1-like [Salvia hispanica]